MAPASSVVARCGEHLEGVLRGSVHHLQWLKSKESLQMCNSKTTEDPCQALDCETVREALHVDFGGVLRRVEPALWKAFG